MWSERGEMFQDTSMAQNHKLNSKSGVKWGVYGGGVDADSTLHALVRVSCCFCLCTPEGPSELPW